MDASQSRRTVLKALAGASVATVAARSSQTVAAQQVGVDSGGIGLLRQDFEAAHGFGTPREQLVDYPNVTVGVPGATIYARYRGEVVDHLEVRWSAATQVGGVDWATAYQGAMTLLPVDAQIRDQFWMPATPEGPVEIIGHAYESAQLNAAHAGLGRVLVLFQRDLTLLTPSSLAEPVVPAVTLTMTSVPQ